MQGREVYVITGVAGNKGTLKNEGKVVIPTSTWKVAVIMPHDQGLANVRDYRDVEVIAVNMPNDPGVRNVDWNTYRTTVDAVETLTGYDLLALLPDEVEAAVESNTQPPLGAITGPAGRDRRRRFGDVRRGRLARSEWHDRQLRLGLRRRHHRERRVGRRIPTRRTARSRCG